MVYTHSPDISDALFAASFLLTTRQHVLRRFVSVAGGAAQTGVRAIKFTTASPLYWWCCSNGRNGAIKFTTASPLYWWCCSNGRNGAIQFTTASLMLMYLVPLQARLLERRAQLCACLGADGSFERAAEVSPRYDSRWRLTRNARRAGTFSRQTNQTQAVSVCSYGEPIRRASLPPRDRRGCGGRRASREEGAAPDAKAEAVGRLLDRYCCPHCCPGELNQLVLLEST
eukprot:1194739-Prorocentrum_minimum.AAC.2